MYWKSSGSNKRRRIGYGGFARTAYGVGSALYGLYRSRKPSRKSFIHKKSMQKMRQRTRSITHNRRRFKARPASAENMSSNYTKFVYRYGPRRKPACEKGLAPIQLYRNAVGRITGAGGAQTATTINTLYDYFDLLDIDNNLPIGNQQFTRHLGATVKLYLTNQVEAPVKIKLYHILSRKDNALDPPAVWAAGMLQQTTDPNASTYVGAVPYSSQQFVANFRVLKTSNFDLPPGANAVCTIRCLNHATIREQYWKTTNNTNFRGLTYKLMAVCHGYPLNDSVLVNNVTSGPVAVDWIATKTLYFTYTERQNQAGNVTNVLTTVPNYRTVAQERSIVEVVNTA